MRLTDKDKFIKALDFLIYELHYPYDPQPFNDWTEEQKETADWFIMHIRRMMEHAQETDAIPIEWIEEWQNKHEWEYESFFTMREGIPKYAIECMIDDWKEEQRKKILPNCVYIAENMQKQAEELKEQWGKENEKQTVE